MLTVNERICTLSRLLKAYESENSIKKIRKIQNDSSKC